MNKTKGVVVVALFISVIFMGVFYSEEATIQTGTNTGYDGGSWYFRSRSNETTPTVSQQDYGTRGSTTVVGNGGRSQEQLATGSATTSKYACEVESNITASTLGAGCVLAVTVRPGYRYYTVEELEKGLLHELKPLAPYFVQAQETYGIDAVFLAAVAAEESGWGRYQFRKNNIFGFENCDFDSLEQCIDYAANWLSYKYLTPSGVYYEGLSVVDVNKHYNGRSDWEDHVVAIMGQIVDRIERNDTE